MALIAVENTQGRRMLVRSDVQVVFKVAGRHNSQPSLRSLIIGTEAEGALWAAPTDLVAIRTMIIKSKEWTLKEMLKHSEIGRAHV